VLLAGLSQATRIELRKVGAGRWLIIASAAVGLMVAVIVGLTAEGFTFSLASFYVQSTISLPLPFVSILLITRDFDRRALSQTYLPIVAASRMVAAKLVASMIIALTAASYGIVLSVLVTNFAPAAAAEPWHGIGMIMIGSALVQLIAQLTGAGFGLLLRFEPGSHGRRYRRAARTMACERRCHRPSRPAGLVDSIRCRAEAAVRPDGCTRLGSRRNCRVRLGRRAQLRWDAPAHRTIKASLGSVHAS
jgi:hypothetical protein